MDSNKRFRLTRETQEVIPGLPEPFTTYDAYMELISVKAGGATRFDTVESILEDLEDEHALIQPPDLNRGWWKVPRAIEDLIQIAREISSGPLSGAMEAAIEAGIKDHGDQGGPGVIPSSRPPHKQTMHALKRRGVAEYRKYGDGSRRRSAWYLEPTLEEQAQHRKREAA
jgi:hypothetical protein